MQPVSDQQFQVRRQVPRFGQVEEQESPGLGTSQKLDGLFSQRPPTGLVDHNVFENLIRLIVSEGIQGPDNVSLDLGIPFLQKPDNGFARKNRCFTDPTGNHLAGHPQGLPPLLYTQRGIQGLLQKTLEEGNSTAL